MLHNLGLWLLLLNHLLLLHNWHVLLLLLLLHHLRLLHHHHLRRWLLLLHLGVDRCPIIVLLIKAIIHNLSLLLQSKLVLWLLLLLLRGDLHLLLRQWWWNLNLLHYEWRWRLLKRWESFNCAEIAVDVDHRRGQWPLDDSLLWLAGHDVVDNNRWLYCLHGLLMHHVLGLHRLEFHRLHDWIWLGFRLLEHLICLDMEV